MGINSAIDSSGAYSGSIVAACRNNAVGAAVNQLAGMQIVRRAVLSINVVTMTVQFSMLFIFPVFDISTGFCSAFYIFIADVGKADCCQLKIMAGCDKAVFIINSIGVNSHIGTGKNIGGRAVEINGPVLHNAMKIAPGIIIIAIQTEPR